MSNLKYLEQMRWLGDVDEKPAVLLCIKPQHVDRISKNEKTLEVRKTVPMAMMTPFKCYIYCGKNPHTNWGGYVVGEFVCDYIKYLQHPITGQVEYADCKAACMSGSEMNQYVNGKRVWGMHISDLKIYATPQTLHDMQFYIPNPITGKPNRSRITTAPMNWCYVAKEG